MPGLLLRGCQPNRGNIRQLAVTVRHEQPVAAWWLIAPAEYLRLGDGSRRSATPRRSA